jgi:small-conductance mechanosensitive channel
VGKFGLSPRMTNASSATIPIAGLRQGNLFAQMRGVIVDASIWFASHWFAIAIAIGAGVAIFGVLLVLRGWAVRLCKRGEGVATWYSIIGRALAKTGSFFMAMAAARLVIGYADAPPVIHTTTVFLFTIVAVFQAAIWAREIIFGAIDHRTRIDGGHDHGLASALGIIRLLVTIALFAISIVLVLGNLGVNVTGLVAGLGVGGIAIGLAAQGVFADLFAALAIIFDRPFRLGDSISYDKGSGSGTVEAIGLKSTRIRGGNGEERIVANRKLLDFEILNTTRRARNRFKFDFHLGYATDPELVRRLPELLKQAVESEGYLLIHGGLNGFSDNGLSYDVEFESSGIDFPPEARDHVAAAVLERFRDQGIGFAYPTMVNLIAEKTKPTPPAGSQGR